MRASILLAATLVAALATTAASASKPWTLDELLSLRTVTDPHISPDGRWVAYVVGSLNRDSTEYQSDVWLVAASGAEARRLTTSEAADESPRWSPDGRTLAFLSERPRPNAPKDPKEAVEDEGKRQIWLIRPDGGEAWPLTAAAGGASSFEWAKDGKSIAFLSREPKSDERKRAEKAKDDAWTPSSKYAWNRLWVIDAASQKAKQLTSGGLHVSSFSFSPDGKRIVFSGQPTPLIPDQFNSDLYLVATSGGAATPLVRQAGLDTDPSWSPDGKWIAFSSQLGKKDAWYANNALCVVSPGGGQVKNLTSDFDEQVDGLSAGIGAWLPDGGSIVFGGSHGTERHLFQAFVDGRTPKQLTHGAGVNTAFDVDDRGAVAVLLREDSDHLREVQRLALPEGAPRAITDTNPIARERPTFHKEVVTWKAPDGRDIEGLLIRPGTGQGAGKSSKPAPMILNVHGGPAGVHQQTCSVASRLYLWPLFVQQGYAVLLPNPRGSGGYGQSFRAANVRDWGGKDYQDLMAGVDAMIERKVADPSRLAVCGWSYGGYMTSTIVTKTDRFRAAVVGAGVTNLTSMAGTCDIPEFNESYFGSWPWQDPQVYIEHSALFHADHVKTPTSLVHGQSDERVPTSQGWEFYTALKKVGVPTDLLLLPRQPHGPREPKLLRRAAQWHLDWINRYTLSPAPVVKLSPKDERARVASAGSH